jgi:hypothetical protein
MKLFHYTSSKNLESILAEGLKPSEGVNPSPDHVLWLTKATTPDWIVADPRRLDTRLQLFIPNNDHKLMKWEHYLRKYEPRMYAALMNDPEFRQHTLGTTWIYFGTLPPTNIREMLEGITYDIRVIDENGRDVGNYDEVRERQDLQKEKTT